MISITNFLLLLEINDALLIETFIPHFSKKEIQNNSNWKQLILPI